MKTVIMPTTNSTIHIKIDASKVGKGHRPHLSGSGKHHDRRTARNRTRSQQRANAFRDD